MTAIATRVFVLTFALLLPTGDGVALADPGDDGGGDGSSCGSVVGDDQQVADARAAADQECDCASARSHGRYVSCVAHVANAAVHDARLRKECHDAVVECAARSTCGRRGRATCCRTDLKGQTHCSIRRASADCRAPHGGTACSGTVASCCDACAPGSTCPPPGSTTTTIAGVTTTTSRATTTTTAPASTTTTLAATTTTTAAPSTTTTTRIATTTTTAPATTTTTAAPVTTTTTRPTTTTTTTTTSTTTTTTRNFTSLSFTTLVGTTSCGPAGLATPPPPPTSGELDSDTAGTTKLVDLGLGCLYFGGGAATVVAGGKIPDGATSFLNISGPGTLSGSTGTGPANCTVGAGPGRHCVNNNSLPSCTSDINCGGSAGSCALDANCFFGPPLPIVSPPPFGSLTTCVLNVVQTNAGGTFTQSTGDSTVSLPLSSRVYITGNTVSPCPKCLSGACDPSWKTNTNTTSPDTGAACTPVGAQLTTIQCRPSLPGFQAPLPVDLTPLTSGTASATAANGIFCPNQTDAGAFGQPSTQRIAETGLAAGNLGDGAPHNSHLGSVFCIPATGNAAVDGVADLPGPGAIGLNGTAQLH